MQLLQHLLLPDDGSQLHLSQLQLSKLLAYRVVQLERDVHFSELLLMRPTIAKINNVVQ